MRYNLIGENKTGQYLKYAIGEILLVVIGILIALQVNEWNENEKRSLTEKHYLNELKIEFSKNLDELHRVINSNTSNCDNALTIANYEASDFSTLSDSSFNKLLFYAILSEIQYRPSPGTLNEIINAGKLEIISNKQLRSKLSSWDGILLKVRFQEDEHSKIRYKLLNLVYAKGNMRNGYLDTEYNDFGLKPKYSNAKNSEFLTNQEFNNLITSFYLTGKYLNTNYYNDLKLNIEETLDLIDTQLKL